MCLFLAGFAVSQLLAHTFCYESTRSIYWAATRAYHTTITYAAPYSFGRIFWATETRVTKNRKSQINCFNGKVRRKNSIKTNVDFFLKWIYSVVTNSAHEIISKLSWMPSVDRNNFTEDLWVPWTPNVAACWLYRSSRLRTVSLMQQNQTTTTTKSKWIMNDDFHANYLRKITPKTKQKENGIISWRTNLNETETMWKARLYTSMDRVWMVDLAFVALTSADTSKRITTENHRLGGNDDEYDGSRMYVEQTLP